MTKHTPFYKMQRIKAKREKIALVLCCTLLAGLLLAGMIKMWERNNRASDLMAMQQAAQTPNLQAVTGTFALQDHTGATIRDTDFKGKFRIVTFGYTYCPDICPTGLSAIAHALDALGNKAKDVAALFITIDPARDQPQKLHEYVTGFHPAIISLTGNEAATAAAAKAFQVYYKRVTVDEEEGDSVPPAATAAAANATAPDKNDAEKKEHATDGHNHHASIPDEEDYEIDHSTLIYLLDRNGKLLRTFPDETAPSEIVKAITEAK